MIITEKKDVVGTLLTQGEEYDMLELYPRNGRDVPFLLRESSFEFYVVVEGFAQYIIVSRGSFAIIPLLEPVEWSVKFFVEGEEEESEEITIPDKRIASIFPDKHHNRIWKKSWSPKDPIRKFDEVSV